LRLNSLKTVTCIQKDLNTSNAMYYRYAGKEDELGTVLPQGLPTLPLRAQSVDPVNKV